MWCLHFQPFAVSQSLNIWSSFIFDESSLACYALMVCSDVQFCDKRGWTIWFPEVLVCLAVAWPQQDFSGTQSCDNCLYWAKSQREVQKVITGGSWGFEYFIRLIIRHLGGVTVSWWGNQTDYPQSHFKWQRHRHASKHLWLPSFRFLSTSHLEHFKRCSVYTVSIPFWISGTPHTAICHHYPLIPSLLSAYILEWY